MGILSKLSRSKYRYMEQSTSQRQKSLEAKIPEMEETLLMLRMLKDAHVRCADDLVRPNSTLTGQLANA